ncbi:hypothetical protein GLU60_01180 [Nanohaloarchaea archaeon H01]|nr:hypothetical protein [Nanohaloarchaea archaeon H01]
MSKKHYDRELEDSSDDYNDLEEAIETVFDYLPEGEELTFDEIYSFTRDKGSSEEAFDELTQLSNEDISSRLEDGDFVYWT